MSGNQEGPASSAPAADYHLRLYVAGQTARSVVALANLQRLCEEHLAGRYSLEVIDLKEQPHLARHDNIVAIPTLVRRLPPPLRRIVGDLSNVERTLVGLEILENQLAHEGAMQHGAADTAAASSSEPQVELHLFVTGASPRSQRAIAGLTAVCEELLPGRYALRVTDIYQQPESAREHQLLAAPTLIRYRPLPIRRLVGDLSNRRQLLDALGVGAQQA